MYALDQLKTMLALSRSCNMSCASLGKLDSTDKAHSPELCFVAENLCQYIALHCIAVVALQLLHCIAVIALHCMV